MNLSELKLKSMPELMDLAVQYNVENPNGMRKQELIFALLQSCASQNGSIFGEGVLEILPDGFGFLRSPMYSYMPGRSTLVRRGTTRWKRCARTGGAGESCTASRAMKRRRGRRSTWDFT